MPIDVYTTDTMTFFIIYRKTSINQMYKYIVPGEPLRMFRYAVSHPFYTHGTTEKITGGWYEE